MLPAEDEAVLLRCSTRFKIQEREVLNMVLNIPWVLSVSTTSFIFFMSPDISWILGKVEALKLSPGEIV